MDCTEVKTGLQEFNLTHYDDKFVGEFPCVPKFLQSENKERGIEKRGKPEVMKELDRKINLWTRERLIPQLIEKESNAEFTITRPTGAFFISDLFFVTFHSVDNANKSVVVKLAPQEYGVDSIKQLINFNELFTNEILFYNQIAHLYTDSYPKCYLAGKDPIFNSVIVLEDVRPRGYTVMSSKKVNVELDFIVAGLKSISRFHGHTYAVKEKEPSRFREIVRSIGEIRYKQYPVNEVFKNMINSRIPRVSQALQAKYRDSEYAAAICNLFEDVFTNVLMKCVKPIEPLATIVHGDCTINNILYRKKSVNEQLESMLIDYGLIMHSSPATDVAVFLYMTCKREDIRDRSEQLFSVYYDNLVECMQENGIWDPIKYSRKAFWQEYRERAVFGYISAVFFRHMMIIYERNHVIPELNESTNDQFFQSAEGKDFVDALLDMLDDLWEAGMLDHLLKAQN